MKLKIDHMTILNLLKLKLNLYLDLCLQVFVQQITLQTQRTFLYVTPINNICMQRGKQCNLYSSTFPMFVYISNYIVPYFLSNS